MLELVSRLLSLGDATRLLFYCIISRFCPDEIWAAKFAFCPSFLIVLPLENAIRDIGNEKNGSVSSKMNA